MSPEVPHLHAEVHGGIHGQEEERGPSPHLRHRRGRLPGDDDRRQEPVHPDHVSQPLIVFGWIIDQPYLERLKGFNGEEYTQILRLEEMCEDKRF